MEDTPLVKPPWHLEGSGYILIYKFSKKEIDSSFFLTERFIKIRKGGIGAVMIVDYKKTDVGPYQELLIIPGKFSYNKKKKGTISKIFVSTQDSVVNGIENWAIPKEKADFSFIKESGGLNKIVVNKEEKRIFEISLKNYGPLFPINTLFLPFPLAQERNGFAYYTKFEGSGLGQLSSIKSIDINKSEFPDISNKKLLLAVRINPFKITFPSAKIEEIK